MSEHRKESKLYSGSIVAKIADNSATQMSSTTASKPSQFDRQPNRNNPTFASLLNSSTVQSPRSSFPPLNAHTHKRRRTEENHATPTQQNNSAMGQSSKSATPNPSLKGRVTVTGTSTNHGLSAPVRKDSRLQNQRSAISNRLPRSVYLRNFATSVTVETIAGIIKIKIPQVADNEFMVRILVKKDQPLEDLSFVYFRVH